MTKILWSPTTACDSSSFEILVNEYATFSSFFL